MKSWEIADSKEFKEPEIRTIFIYIKGGVIVLAWEPVRLVHSCFYAS